MNSSGKFILRTNPKLHEKLKNEARAANLSLNEYCLQKLSVLNEDVTNLNFAGFDEVIKQAQTIHGPTLCGAVVYGSWVKGQLTSSSDVDVLLVLQTGSLITRQIYRKWDLLDLRIGDHKVEPSIVALPLRSDRVSGFWATIATEGIVFWSDNFSLHHYLVDVRLKIAAGLLRREKVHGQTYWILKPEVA